MLTTALSPNISLHTLTHAWQTGDADLLTLSIEICAAILYLAGVWRLARKGRRWSAWRSASFIAAVASLVVALQSGLAHYDDTNFSAHVIQHMILMYLAPILLALSAPTTLALQASKRRTQEVILKVLHCRAVGFISHPIVAATVAFVSMIAYYLTPLYVLSLEHPVLHASSHVFFLLSGCVFWWIIVGKDPQRWRLSFPAKLGLLAAGIPVTAILGLALSQARTSIAPHFHTAADTRAGGSILWVIGELVMLVAMGLLLFQWMRVDEREAVRADRRAELAEGASAERPVPASRD
ncbi:MAG: cytochrome c oxidase assembly protein [Acidimicrobiales bacterium]